MCDKIASKKQEDVMMQNPICSPWSYAKPYLHTKGSLNGH